MPRSQTRREFIQEALLAGVALPLAAPLAGAAMAPPRPVASANERLRLGIIGVDGRGAANFEAVSGEEIVVLCDIDRNHLAAAKQKRPQAATCEDWRAVFDHKLDAVVISTPDHMHAIPAAAAMARGLDVYCEKPLAHSVFEVRVLRRLAAARQRVTQLGTQIHAGDNYRRAVEIVRSGVLGPVRRVHVWMNTSQPIAGQRAAQGKPPPHVNYELWLGPAPARPFHPSHFHFNWRYWFDFGGGILADFGCHYMDLPHWALELGAPTSIEARGEKTYQGDNDVPDNLQVDYRYPARGERPAVHLTWYQGKWRPEGAEPYQKGAAVLFEGEKGRLVADYGSRQLFVKAEEALDETKLPGFGSIPGSLGQHREWLEAIRSRGPTTCNFDYSGALTEAVLLGNVAYRAGGKRLEWDSAALKVTNEVPAAAAFIRREYRKGWTLEGAEA